MARYSTAIFLFIFSTSLIVVVNSINCFSGNEFPSGTVYGQSILCPSQQQTCSNRTYLNPNGSLNYRTYSCDLLNICVTENANNSCRQENATAQLCCCSTDNCNRGAYQQPETRPERRCYSSLVAGGYICKDGWCVNTTVLGSFGQTAVTTYGCDNLHFCNNNNLTRECNTGNSSSTTMCCCNSGDYCNKLDYTEPTTINCYSDIGLGSPSEVECKHNYCKNTTWYRNNGSILRQTFACDILNQCGGDDLLNSCERPNTTTQICCCQSDFCNKANYVPMTTRAPGGNTASRLNCLLPIAIFAVMLADAYRRLLQFC